MSKSILYLFKVKFRPENNAWVDNLATYLNKNLVATVNEFQFIKHGLELNIVIDLPQTDARNLKFNYVGIINDTDKRMYYYFVASSEWKSTKSLRLNLSMDTVNTFQDKITWDPKTKIIRQHKPRYYPDSIGGDTYLRKVDKSDEGLNGLPKKRIRKIAINETADLLQDVKWYLIYNSDNKVTTDPNEVTPVSCYLVPSTNGIRVKRSGGYQLIYKSDIPENDPVLGSAYKVFTYEDNPDGSIVCKGVEYFITPDISIMLFRGLAESQPGVFCSIIDNNTSDLLVIPVPLSPNYVTLKNINISRNVWSSYALPNDYKGTSTWYQIVKQAGDTTVYLSGGDFKTLNSINDVDRSKTTLLKIIELGYSPSEMKAADEPGVFEIPKNWSLSSPSLGIKNKTIVSLKLEDLGVEFGRYLPSQSLDEFRVIMPSLMQRYKTLRTDKYESKIYNSAYYTHKYFYDSYSMTLKYENITIEAPEAPAFRLYFKPTNTINSNLLFKISPRSNNCRYLNDEDYDTLFISSRNNEMPLYNSSYINYLRNGYNYDVKQKNIATSQARFNVGLNLVGATISAGAAVATGGLSLVAATAFGTNAISSISNLLTSELKANESLQHNLDELRAQAASVSGSNDLDLLKYYNGNKLWMADYDLYDNTKKLVYDLFHFTGYAVNKNGIPDTDSRRCFNFLQCEADFGENDFASDWIDYIDDVKARYQAGVTYFHNFAAAPTGDANIYDFDQELENWELFICPRD